MTVKTGLVAATFAFVMVAGCGDDDDGDSAAGPAFDVTGDWDVIIHYNMSPLPSYTITVVMDTDGAITGTIDGPQGPGTVVGSLSGSVLTITSVDDSDGAITDLSGIVDALGTSIGGVWEDPSESGLWYGTKIVD
jgi:hypothetical protein